MEKIKCSSKIQNENPKQPSNYDEIWQFPILNEKRKLIVFDMNVESIHI